MRVPRRQSGMTLVITMLFLIVIAMFAIATYSTSTTNTQVTGNMVVRNEAMAAAQALIDETISSNMFTIDPIAVANQDYNVDIDADGEID